MTQTPGLDTIKGLVGEPPNCIAIAHKTMRTQELLRQTWNASYIAIIPHCFKCHEPLVWHIPPDGENNSTLFHCPKCKRIWIKDEEWQKKDDTTEENTKTTG